MFAKSKNRQEHHDRTHTAATVNTSASAMGYMCRFFCTCTRDSDVINPSNQGQPQTPKPEHPEPAHRTQSL